MSIPQGNPTGGCTQFASTRDTIPTRRVSDNFSSSRSYAPECKYELRILSGESESFTIRY
jgi:hypothetical protein